MADASSPSNADQLLATLWQETRLVDLIIQGCIEYRWAMAEEEREIATAMIYNAFESHARASGMSVQQAETFCEQHLNELIQTILRIL